MRAVDLPPLVRNLRKSGGVDAMARGLGSVAISALARANLMLLRDPDDPDARILTWPCLRGGPQPASIRWRFGRAEEGKPPRIVWDNVACDLTADEILERADNRGRPDSAAGTAERFLREALAAGPMPTTELVRLAEEAGVNSVTLKRARGRLGGLRKKRGRAWWATLPPGRGSDPRACTDDPLDPVDPLHPGQEDQQGKEDQESLLGEVIPLKERL